MPGPDFVDGDVLEEGDIDALPKGVLGYAEVRTDQAGITTVVDITSLSVAVTVLANRYIRITHYVESFYADAADDAYILFIKEGGTTLQTRTLNVNEANEGGQGGLMSVILTNPSAGAHTYKIAAGAATGASTGTHAASTNAPAYILVEDLGAT